MQTSRFPALLLSAACLAIAGRAAAQEGPRPVMVVVTAGDRVDDEAVATVQGALVEGVTAMAGGRPVHALAAPALRDAIVACADDPCIGAQLAEAGAEAAVIARLSAERRDPLQIAIELRAPVSGAARAEPIRGELPRDRAAIPAAVSALIEPLRAVMPAPPPPPASLLVTVNVDGASVRVDGEAIGVSPVAPVEVEPGAHEIAVTLDGYASERRQEQIEPGEQSRVDVTLRSLSAVAAPTSAAAGGDVTEEWWFWTAIGGGAALVIGVAIGIGFAVSSGGGMPAGQPDPTGIMLPPLMGGM